MTSWLRLLPLGAAVVVGLLAGIPIGYLKGVPAGKLQLKNQMLEDRIISIQKGKEIDERILSADDSALCDWLGGC